MLSLKDRRGSVLPSILLGPASFGGKRVSASPCRANTNCSTICIYSVRYEWDEKKNLGNQRKHQGISFELATLVFEDRNCFVVLDRIDQTGEHRWHAIGQVRIEPGVAAVLLVVHTHREEHYGEEIIRIISARRAEKHEVHRYQAAAMD